MMFRHLSIPLVLVSITAGAPLRAATKPHAALAPANVTWTNENLQRFRKFPDSISIVGQPTKQGAKEQPEHHEQGEPKDPAWYAAQAASLNAQLESEQADLRNFTEALDDARELKSTAAGLDLLEGDVALTPEATTDVLQIRVRETLAELDALEDLARRNGIEPGVLRSTAGGFVTYGSSGSGTIPCPPADCSRPVSNR